ncbi:MAG TPA: hypothetical protein VK151_14830 [Fluviicola sp.]|nr:hypothetical protein [Fluviicola sp.]
MYRWIVFVMMLLGFMPVAVSQADTSILLPNRLVISSVENPKKYHVLDSTGNISIVCVNKTDSVIRIQYRELTGKLVYFTDSSLVLHVKNESILTYNHNGTYSDYYYYQKRDSIKQHFDTLQFSEVYSIRHDKGKHRKTIGMMQSSAYMFMTACFGVIITSLALPKSTNIVHAKNAVIISSTCMAAGAGSYLFYPKIYKVNNQLDKKKRVKWKIEVL